MTALYLQANVTKLLQVFYILIIHLHQDTVNYVSLHYTLGICQEKLMSINSSQKLSRFNNYI